MASIRRRPSPCDRQCESFCARAATWWARSDLDVIRLESPGGEMITGRSHRTFLLLSVKVASVCRPALCDQPAQPSLAETLAWMDSTYNPHSDTGGAWGHGREEIFTP